MSNQSIILDRSQLKTCFSSNSFLHVDDVKEAKSAKADLQEVYPTSITFESMLGPSHSDIYEIAPSSINYAETAIAWIEYWIWHKTGCRVTFTNEEILDLAIDATESPEYEHRSRESLQSLLSRPKPSNEAVISAYRYNSNLSQHYFTSKQPSSRFQLFKDLVDKQTNGQLFEVKELVDLPFNTSIVNVRKNAIKALSSFGPFIYTTCIDKGKDIICSWLAFGANSIGLYLRDPLHSSTIVLDKWLNAIKNTTNGQFNFAPLLPI